MKNKVIDKFNVNMDRIYRIQGENDSQPSMCPAIGNQISQKIPEVLKTVSDLTDPESQCRLKCAVPCVVGFLA